MIFKEIEIGQYNVFINERGVYCNCEYGLIHHDQWESAKPLCKHIKQAIIKANEIYNVKNIKR